MIEKQQKILQMAKDICRVKLNCNDVCKPVSACDALKYAERAVEAGYSKQEWISVDERLPQVCGTYICCVKDKYGNTWTIPADFSPEMKTWFGQFGEVKNTVTHWMPLPEAPKMKGGAE